VRWADRLFDSALAMTTSQRWIVLRPFAVLTVAAVTSYWLVLKLVGESARLQAAIGAVLTQLASGDSNSFPPAGVAAPECCRGFVEGGRFMLVSVLMSGLPAATIGCVSALGVDLYAASP
jgi:hypothetical protein